MDLYEFDQTYRLKGFALIAGLDEAGRGPLAGPVVGAAVILPDKIKISGLNDSKKLTHKRRESIYEQILSCAVSYGIGVVSHTEIDSMNILEASKLAMQRAIMSLDITPDLLIIDALRLANTKIDQESVIKGDSKSASVAAASVIAKVTRDRMMIDIHNIFPQYGFDRHKGYPTKQHYLAIEMYGVCPYHRKTFRIKNPYKF